MSNRKYTKTRRAEQQEQTRQRIVDALIELHQELGPAATTVKAVAEKAGVQRLTVYRHFPDEDSLFQACTSHWLAINPPPGPHDWSDGKDPAEKSHRAFRLFYAYYRGTEAMWQASYRDLEHVPALQEPMQQFESYLDDLADALLKAWKPKQAVRKNLQATLRHGLSFATWQSLEHAKLRDEKKAMLVMSWLNGVIRAD